MDKSNSILFLGDVIPFKPFKFRNDYKTVINYGIRAKTGHNIIS